MQPITPGWKKFSIKPNLGDLEWCKGIVPSIAGEITVELKKLIKDNIEKGLQIKAAIPKSTSAEIHVPVQPSKNFSIEVNNQEIWRNGLIIQRNQNIILNTKTDHLIVIEFQSGEYIINVRIN